MCRVYQMPPLSVPESTGLRIGPAVTQKVFLASAKLWSAEDSLSVRSARSGGQGTIRGMSRNPGSSLAGKAVLITGGAKRLGRASALALARAGADVAITFWRSAREAQHAVIDLGSLGVRAFALHCDVTREKSVKEMVKEAVKELGGIDILVNNAANYETVDFEKISIAQWDAIFASNTRGPFLVT